MNLREGIIWMWKVSGGSRLAIAVNTILGLLQVAASLSFIWISKMLVDLATGVHAEPIWPYAIMMVTCMLLQTAIGTARSRWSRKAVVRLTARLRYRAFASVMESRWTGKEKFHSGDILGRITEDASYIADLLCSTVPSAFVTLIQLAAAFFMLFALDGRLALILVPLMPAALLISKAYMKKMRALTKDIKETDSLIKSMMQEDIQHRTVIKTLEMTAGTTSEVSHRQGSLEDKLMKRTDFSLYARTMVQIGFLAGYSTAFLWGIYGLKDGAITFGMMTAFLQLVSQIQRPAVDLSRQIPSASHALTYAERLKELEDLPSEEEGESIMLEGPAGIRFDSVDFTYPDGTRKIADNFTHDFTPGSSTALTGETGAGKSTLIRLMLALLSPDRGRITIYNSRQEIPVSPATRRNIIYVPQGNTLMSGTIRDNLLMGDPSADEQKLRLALHTAAADFVFSLPEGLDTQCGELGAGLSEGQAQRIAIARGLLRPGSILLLDEPTSSLDPATETLLLTRLGESMPDKTVIIVTHREAAAARCTDILQVVRSSAPSGSDAPRP